jgi:hypothetical protein
VERRPHRERNGLTVKWDTGLLTYWRAALLAELGDKPRAVQLLKTAHQRGQGKTAWHYNLPLRALRGYAPFEELITPVR